jgi:glycerate kinase
MALGAAAAGWTTDVCPLSDGGEGFLEVLGVLDGELREILVTGPQRVPVSAKWMFSPDVAIIESAQASGLVLAGGRDRNDPIRATTRGTGELINAAVESGAKRVIVGVGGSATTDGGLGAVQAIDEAGGLKGKEVLVATDVTVPFVDAARIFGPQKGADAAQIDELEERLKSLSERYRQGGADVSSIPGSGAAGGLAGGLAARGAKIVGGFDLVASLVDLRRRIAAADLVMTGEGQLDKTSWVGKVVGGVIERAGESGTFVIVVAGQIAPDALDDAANHAVLRAAVDLTERFGSERAIGEPASCVEAAAKEALLRD